MEFPFDEPTLPSLHVLEENEPTERFALQRCPACGSMTPVALCLHTTTCEVCLHPLDVAPLRAS
jgi:hypothetical protein